MKTLYLIKKNIRNLAIATIASLFYTPTVHATDFYVTSIIRDFPMKAGDTTYKDYYVNAGSNNGLRKGALLDAARKVPIFDNINSKLLGDSSVKIAKLKVIHLDKGYCIARLVNYYAKDVTPATGNDSVMIGDLIEVADKQN